MPTFLVVLANGERLSVDDANREKILAAAGKKPYVEVEVLTDSSGPGSVRYDVFLNNVVMVGHAT